MDKLKQFLEIGRKYHFWILCAIAAVAGVAAWYLSSGKLAAEFQQDSNSINGVFTSLRGVDPQGPHSDWADGIKKETASVAVDVKSAWTDLYNEQKKNVFVWPTKDLSAEFLAAAAQLDDPKAELPRNLREYYQRRVQKLASQLPGLVDAEEATGPAAGNVLAGVFNAFGGNAPAGPAHKVVWAPSSQQEIQESFDWTERPSTLLIKYAQEELWVYQALCNVINTVNAGTTSRADAHITDIDAFDIAYNAVEDSPGGTGLGRVEPLGNSGAGGAAAPVGPAGQGPGGASMRPDPKMRGKKDSGGLRFGAAASADATANPDDLLKNYRYVKADGTPQMKDDVDGDTNEYRLMPFRLLLKMDSRYVDRLLVAFRNSVLPMEVQEVRINPEHTSSGGSGGGGGRFAPGPGGPGIGGGGHGIGPVATATTTSQADRDVTVEIHGVVYLIKPPDAQKLTVGTEDATASGAPATTPEPAAATPAPGTETTPAPAPATETPAPAAGAAAPGTPPGTAPAGAPPTTEPTPTTAPGTAVPPVTTPPAAAAPPNP